MKQSNNQSKLGSEIVTGNSISGQWAVNATSYAGLGGYCKGLNTNILLKRKAQSTPH
jgi:hypothetical protein